MPVRNCLDHFLAEPFTACPPVPGVGRRVALAQASFRIPELGSGREFNDPLLMARWY